jgi:uncharacterized membrane protein
MKPHQEMRNQTEQYHGEEMDLFPERNRVAALNRRVTMQEIKNKRGLAMSNEAHLWAVGYDDMVRAEQVREEIIRLTGPGQYLFVYDAVVAVRHADGSLTFNRGETSVVESAAGGGLLGLLAVLALAASPLTGVAVGALLGCAAATAARTAGIDERFMRDVADILRPGTSALFVLDDVGDMDVILHSIRGLGGTLLKTNVNLERARLIQSTLNANDAK